MPVVMTYTSLTEDIKNYLERGGVSDPIVLAQIPNFIQFGQTRLNREAKGLITQTVQTSFFTPGNPIVQKPAYWRSTKSFNFGTGTGFNTRNFLQLRGYEYCRAFWVDPTQTGVPQFYADYNYEHWLIVPTPALAYPFEVIEDDFVFPIDSVNQTNFWTRFCPDLLLHACLMEAQVFLKNIENYQPAQQYFDRLLKGVDFEEEIRKADRTQKADLK